MLGLRREILCREAVYHNVLRYSPIETKLKLERPHTLTRPLADAKNAVIVSVSRLGSLELTDLVGLETRVQIE